MTALPRITDNRTLVKWRDELKLTNRYIARLIGLNETVFSKIVCGRSVPPGDDPHQWYASVEKALRGHAKRGVELTAVADESQ